MSFSLLESKKPAAIPLSSNWAKAEVPIPETATIKNSRLNLFIAFMDFAIMFLYVFFLNECREGTEYDLHIQSKTIGLAIDDVELLALLG